MVSNGRRGYSPPRIRTGLMPRYVLLAGPACERRAEGARTKQEGQMKKPPEVSLGWLPFHGSLIEDL